MSDYWTRPLTEEELAKEMGIIEDQAENSDIGGDSDADDDTDREVESSSTRSSIRSSGLVSPSSSGVTTPELSRKRKRFYSNHESTSNVGDDYDYDSDDSVADKTYHPNEPRPLEDAVLENGDTDDEQPEELEEIVQDFSSWVKTAVTPATFINYDFVDEMGPNVQVFLFLLSLYV